MTDRNAGKATIMPLGEHLDELRKRVMLAVFGIVPIFVVALVFSKTILAVIMKPLVDAMGVHHVTDKLQVTGLMEGFLNWVKAALIVTIAVGAPWLLYQLWRFVAPGLYQRERRFAHILAPLSVVMTLVGVAFMYFIVLKFALGFFVHFNQTLAQRSPTATAPLPDGVSLGRVPVLDADPAEIKPGDMWVHAELRQLRIAIAPPSDQYSLPGMGFLKFEKSAEQKAAAANQPPAAPIIVNMPLGDDALIAQHYKLSEYLSTILKFSLAAAIAFQVPVVVLLLGWVGILRREAMKKYRKHVCAGITIVAMVFTPPDPFSMIIMIGAMYGLFELGLLLLWLMPADRVAEGTVFRRAGSIPAALPSGTGSSPMGRTSGNAPAGSDGTDQP